MQRNVQAGELNSKICNTRAKHWSFQSDAKCAGQWTRMVCTVASGDLPWIIAAPQMFLNKIRLEDSSTTFRCLELWYRDRVSARHLANDYISSSSLADLGYRFNLTYFSQQPFVRQRRLISIGFSTSAVTRGPTLFPTQGLTSSIHHSASVVGQV